MMGKKKKMSAPADDPVSPPAADVEEGIPLDDPDLNEDDAGDISFGNELKTRSYAVQSVRYNKEEYGEKHS